MPLRVAVLVDLPRESASGGHVKYWERFAQAAAKENIADLTVYFSGHGDDELLSPCVRFRYLPPVFSTAKLKFLPYVPAHTDLAPFHPRLAKELIAYDVLHTTDAYFAFARTAERIAKRKGKPLVTSFHTDTPAYAEVFTRQTIQKVMGRKVGGWIDDTFQISYRQRLSKEKRLKKHLSACSAALAMRPEDLVAARDVLAVERVASMRLGVDKDLFRPRTETRAQIEREYTIPAGKFLVLFVGRVDIGKNMPLLLKACVKAIQEGVPLHLLVAGLGPMSEEVAATLGKNTTLAGLVTTEKLAEFYAAADCLAMASDIEIGGLVGVEALSCGCPVLVSGKSGVAALCDRTEAMQEIESDVPSWTQAIVSFWKDKAKQSAMRSAALSFRRDHIASWADIFKDDFLPIWKSARY